MTEPVPAAVSPPGAGTGLPYDADGIAKSGHAPVAFAFGDAEPVLDRATLWGMASVWTNGRWREPPVSLAHLARSIHVSPHHASAINLKRNLLVRSFVPTRWLDRANFGRFAKDYLALGNAYFECIPNLAGRPLRLDHALALYMRRGTEDDQYFFVPAWGGGPGKTGEHEFERGRVFQLREPDLEQEVYGVPEWLAALQSGLLNEAATLFRRRYYLNGAHAGFMLYLSEASINNEDADAIRAAMSSAKGLGNFKNMFVHAPNGKKDGLQVIPFSEVATKDDFMNIKEATRDDVLAAHRVPPQLLGVVPKNNGGFGDIRSATAVFYANEIEPLQERMREVNDWLGVEAVVFRPSIDLIPPPPG